MSHTHVQCHIDIIIYDCHTLSMKVEPVMSDTLVQCHIDMVIYDCHIPTMKVETVMSDTPLLDSSVATCGWVGVYCIVLKHKQQKIA